MWKTLSTSWKTFPWRARPTSSRSVWGSTRRWGWWTPTTSRANSAWMQTFRGPFHFPFPSLTFCDLIDPPNGHFPWLRGLTPSLSLTMKYSSVYSHFTGVLYEVPSHGGKHVCADLEGEILWTRGWCSLLSLEALRQVTCPRLAKTANCSRE